MHEATNKGKRVINRTTPALIVRQADLDPLKLVPGRLKDATIFDEERSRGVRLSAAGSGAKYDVLESLHLAWRSRHPEVAAKGEMDSVSSEENRGRSRDDEQRSIRARHDLELRQGLILRDIVKSPLVDAAENAWGRVEAGGRPVFVEVEEGTASARDAGEVHVVVEERERCEGCCTRPRGRCLAASSPDATGGPGRWSRYVGRAPS